MYIYICIYIYMYVCVYIYIYVPEKGGRKPAPSLKERLYVPVRNSQEPWESVPSFFPTLRHSDLRITAHPLANCLACKPPIHSSTFLFCNPSTLQPRSHCSSPCKLSWSEPNGHCSPLTFDSLLFFQLPDSALRFFHRLPSFAVPRFVSTVLV